MAATVAESLVSISSTSKAKTQRYEALDSLRGIAACWVVIFHLPSDGHHWPLPIVQNGFLAVTFFFVLSGFVIGASYGEKLLCGHSISKFMFLRWGRVYPLHVFVLVVLLLYELIRLVADLGAFREGAPFTGLTAPAGLLWSLALLQQVPAELSWNKPSWSIGVEYWTYLAAALLLHLLPIRRMLAAAIVLMAPGVFLLVAGLGRGMALPAEIVSLLNCTLGFGIGLAIFDLRRMGWKLLSTTSRWSATLLELFVVILVLIAAWTFGGRTSNLVFPAFGLMIWVFASQSGQISRALLAPPMLILGTLSYSIYMIHQFIQDRILDVIAATDLLPLTVTQSGRLVLTGDPWLCDLVTTVMLSIVIGVSWFTYRYVEEPARHWSRKVAERWFPAQH